MKPTSPENHRILHQMTAFIDLPFGSIRDRKRVLAADLSRSVLCICDRTRGLRDRPASVPYAAAHRSPAITFNYQSQKSILPLDPLDGIRPPSLVRFSR